MRQSLVAHRAAQADGKIGHQQQHVADRETEHGRSLISRLESSTAASPLKPGDQRAKRRPRRLPPVPAPRRSSACGGGNASNYPPRMNRNPYDTKPTAMPTAKLIALP